MNKCASIVAATVCGIIASSATLFGQELIAPPIPGQHVEAPEAPSMVEGKLRISASEIKAYKSARDIIASDVHKAMKDSAKAEFLAAVDSFAEDSATVSTKEVSEPLSEASAAAEKLIADFKSDFKELREDLASRKEIAEAKSAELLALSARLVEAEGAEFRKCLQEYISAFAVSSAAKTACDAAEAALNEAVKNNAAAAKTYVDGYADNLRDDAEFKEHISEILTIVRKDSPLYATFWAIFPPLLAIVLALITKEVYSALFLGILSGGLIYSNFSFEGTVVHVFSDGFISSVADSYNIGILIFLILLGTLVAMMSKTGASAAFGRWAAANIKGRVGAQIATIILGILIFVDDYFNCLTVGSVMRPVTDAKKVSRAKLAYLVDSTAAPICIIAPISSWAAAVAGFATGAGSENGFSLFIQAIPYNFYAFLTIVMMLFLAVTRFDFGLMRKHEENALAGDLFTSGGMVVAADDFSQVNSKGRVFDLLIPVVFLVSACVVGMIYSGGFFTLGSDGYRDFVVSFSGCDASVGLVYGSAVAVIFAVLFYVSRRVISFKDCMLAFPEGFKAMVPAILILCFAWTLKTMTDSLGAKIFVSQIINGPAAGFQAFLPAIIFVIAVVLSFSSGTSWGTFGILIPIVLAAIPGSEYTIIAISACMAGAVCGDHCSPISDTTIMASAGAQCNHVNHVATQLPYAMLVAAVSFVCYIIAPFVKSAWIALPIAIGLMLATLLVIKLCAGGKRTN